MASFREFKKAVRLEFEKCLKKFPELKNVELIVGQADELSGAEGWLGTKRVVILFVPPILLDKSTAILRPIIYHELSHMLDKENPDRIFFERADESSKELWRKLQKAKALRCEVMK